MSVVDDIKTRIEIVDLVSKYANLRQSGMNYNALCPFHAEKTPSFYVFPNRQSWRCFGACATGGDVFSFFMQVENVDFKGALQQLASQARVELTSQRARETDAGAFQANDAAARFFCQYLASNQGKSAREYLSNRGITPDTIERFKLGLSPSDGHSLRRNLLSLGFSEQQLISAGILAQSKMGSYQDLFRRRIMFPIWDSQGNLSGFGGRSLDDSNPKYINSRQGTTFDKGRTLYALHIARGSIPQQGAVVVEGYMDAIIAHQAGFTNVVASMGTSLTKIQASLLQTLTQDVVLALDPDTAGQQATLRSLETSWEAIHGSIIGQSKRGAVYQKPSVPNLKVATLPDGKDPDNVILEDPQEWERLINDAAPFIHFYFQAMSAQHEITTAFGKSQVADNLSRLVFQINDPFEQDRRFEELAEMLGVTKTALEASLSRLNRSKGPQQTRMQQQASSSPFQKLERDPLEEHCLALLIQNPRLAYLATDLRSEHFQRVDNREVFTNLGKKNTIEDLEEETRTQASYLSHKMLPPSDSEKTESSFSDCIQRLEERRLRLLKEEESLRLSELPPEEIFHYHKEILDINEDIGALFRRRGI
ncbi:DNA primase [SAR202 cluster bacterium AD-804-J14_MRT_500m]|nr:DNA primase [SAR202 cluster bacterium AD-804-J14_MRT_500m]